jgi:DNA primase small subunit
MPHSVSPESTPAEDASATVPQVAAVKAEAETEDVSMEDAPEPIAIEKPKVNLEDLFDDEDSDEEFPSSAPVPTSQEDASQPAPMCAPRTTPLSTHASH